MAKFSSRDLADEDLDEVGITLSMFAEAVQVWSLLQEGPTTVTAAAEAFNAEPQLVRDAVEQHPFMFLVPTDDGDHVIEHDGE